MVASRESSSLVALLVLAERAVATWPTQSTPAPASGGIPWLPILGVLQVCLLCGLGIYAWYLYRLWRRVKPENDAHVGMVTAAPPPRRTSRATRGISAASEVSCPSVGTENRAGKMLTPTKYRGLMDLSPSPNIARTISSSTASPKPKDWPRDGSMLACTTCSKAGVIREGGVRMALSKLFCGSGDKQLALETQLAGP
uniref:Uncharacterized protein n=1 Tax=Alexandrium catenella TaxID=2925 RepID=A0A7S1QRL1_ALECA